MLKNRKRLKEGAGAGYDITLEGLSVDIKNSKIVERDEEGIKIKIPINECYVDRWSAEGYYDSVDSDGIYYDGDLVIEYVKEDRKVEGGTFYVDIDFDYLAFEVDLDDETLDNYNLTEQHEEQIKIIKKMSDKEIINLIKNSKSFEDECGFDKVSVMYGSGWSHSNLDTEMFTLESNHTYGGITESYDGIIVYKADIKSPNIAEDINWFFENVQDFDELFGDEYNED